GLIGMSVYHRQAVLIVLRGHLAGGVGTEGADLIVEGGGVVDQLGFIEILVEELHHLIPHFDTDADVHSSHLSLDTVVVADMGEPVGAFASDGGYNLGGVIGFIMIGDHALYLVSFDDNVLYNAVKFHGDALGQKMLLK